MLFCVIASVNEAIKRVKRSETVDCHEANASRNDKRSATKVAPPNHKKKRAQSYGEAIAQRRFGFYNL